MSSSLRDTYGRELTETANAFKTYGFDVSIRGEGVGRFLLVETTNRGVEISRSEKELFVEFFEKDEPVRENRVTDVHVAIQQAVQWLRE